MFEEISNMVSKVSGAFDDIYAVIKDVPLSSSTRNYTAKLLNSLNAAATDSVKNIDSTSYLKNASQVGTYGKLLSKELSSELTDDILESSSLLEVKSSVEKLSAYSSSLNKLTKEHPEDKRALSDESDTSTLYEGLDANTELNRESKRLATNIAKQDHRVRDLFNAHEVKAEELNSRLKDLAKKVDAELNRAKEVYSVGVDDIELKKSQIDELLGHASNKVISGDYDSTAIIEKEEADKLRRASLSVMVVILVVVCVALWDLTTSGFSWQASLYKLVLITTLSLPAAYLAKESEKHRQKQYSHQQTSLDLKAISPYIATLPEAEQHRIKAEVANRLFAAKGNIGTDSSISPLNIQELIVQLVKKIKSEDK